MDNMREFNYYPYAFDYKDEEEEEMHMFEEHLKEIQDAALLCPHCDGEIYELEPIKSRNKEWYVIECSNCGCSTPYCETPELALETWNARAEKTCTVGNATIKNGFLTIDHTCSNCGYVVPSALDHDGYSNFCPTCGHKTVVNNIIKEI